MDRIAHPSSRRRYLAPLLTVLIALLPVHAIALDVGFQLKPWIVIMIVAALAVGPYRLRSSFRHLPWPIVAGLALIALSAVTGCLTAALQSPEFVMVAARHTIALVLPILLLVIIAVVPQAAIGPGLRAAAAITVVAGLAESVALLLGQSKLLNSGISGFVAAPLGDVIYGNIPVVNALHVDSNFAAMYVVAFTFLLPAFPIDARFRKLDGAILGSLLVVLFLTFSRSGVLALCVGAVTAGVLRRSFRPPPTISVIAAVTMFAAISSSLLTIDVLDGRADLVSAATKRARQVVPEGQQLAAFAMATLSGTQSKTGESHNTSKPPQPSPARSTAAVQPDKNLPRAVVWRRYLDLVTDSPLTGGGYGVDEIATHLYAHNAILEAAAGGGLLGVSGLLLAWVGAAIVGTRAAKGDALFVPAAAAAFFISSLFLTTNYEPVGALVLGLNLRLRLMSAS